MLEYGIYEADWCDIDLKYRIKHQMSCKIMYKYVIFCYKNKQGLSFFILLTSKFSTTGFKKKMF